MALRRPQRTQIVHAGKEDGAEGDPEKRRDPAPDDGYGRTDDGRGARHGSEVVAPQDVFIGGHIVDAVFHGVGRGGVVRG